MEEFKEFFRSTREYVLLSERYSDDEIFKKLDQGSGFSSVYSCYEVYLLLKESQVNVLTSVKNVIDDENLFYETKLEIIKEILQ